MNKLLSKNTPFCPYLIRAFYDWLIDNNNSIYIEVDTSTPNTYIPAEYIEDDDLIVLDISPNAIDKIQISNTLIEFSARFGSKCYALSLPLQSLVGIFSPDNDFGIKFQPEFIVNIPIYFPNYEEENYEKRNIDINDNADQIKLDIKVCLNKQKIESREQTDLHDTKKPFLQILRNKKK